MPEGKAKEGRAFQSPSRYIQGPGEINNLPKFAANYGKSVFAVIDRVFYKDYSRRFGDMFAAAGMTVCCEEYPGVPSDAVFEQLRDICGALPQVPDVFIGMGGGSCCDIIKMPGAYYRKAWFSVPTALTTDAPTAAHTVIHNPGELAQPRFHYKNPDYVVVDTEVTITAPVELLVSGIGDALATYFESLASAGNNNVTYAGNGDYRPTLLGMAAAKECCEILMRDGRAAVRGAAKHLRTAAYENIVEATVLLSGVGVECTGSAVAHGIEAGFFNLPLKKPILHGTAVGYCTLIELIIENRQDDFARVFDFARDIGLPVCTKDLHLDEEDRDSGLKALVDSIYGIRWNLHNEPFYFSKQTLLDAFYYLDEYAAEKAR